MNNSNERYQLIIDGKNKFVAKDAFDKNIDAFVAKYPDMQVRVQNKDGHAGAVPIKNYKSAVEQGGFSPIFDIKDSSIQKVNNAISRATDYGQNNIPAVVRRQMPEIQNTITNTIQQDETDRQNKTGIYTPIPKLPGQTDSDVKKLEAYAKQKVDEEQQRVIETEKESMLPKSIEEIDTQINTIKSDNEQFINEYNARALNLLKKPRTGLFASSPSIFSKEDRTYKEQNKEKYDSIRDNIHNLELQKDLLKSVKQLEDFDNNREERKNFLSGLFHTGKLKDFATFGLTEMIRNKEIANILRKADKGEDLTIDEKKVVVMYNNLQKLESQDRGNSFAAGQMIQNSLGFVRDMMLTGGLGGVAKGIGGLGFKAAMKVAIKNIGKQALKQVAYTPITPYMYTNYTQRNLQNYEIKNYGVKDGDLNHIEVTNKGTSTGEKLYKSFAETYTERFTESIGNALEGVGFAKRLIASKVGRKILGNSFDKLAKITNNNTYRKISDVMLNHTGLNSIPMEMFEEIINVPLQSLALWENQMPQLADKNFYANVALTSILLGGMGSSIRMAAGGVGSAIEHKKAKKEYNDAALQFRSIELNDERLATLRDKLLSDVKENKFLTDNGEVAGSDVMQDVGNIYAIANQTGDVGIMEATDRYVQSSLNRFGQIEGLKAIAQQEIGNEFTLKPSNDEYVAMAIDKDNSPYYITDETDDILIVTDVQTGEKKSISKSDVKNKTIIPTDDFLANWYMSKSAGEINLDDDAEESIPEESQFKQGSTAIYDGIPIRIEDIYRNESSGEDFATVIDESGETHDIPVKDLQSIPEVQEQPAETVQQPEEIENTQIDVPENIEQENELPLDKDGDIDYDVLLDANPDKFTEIFSEEFGSDETIKQLSSAAKGIDNQLQALSKKLDKEISLTKKSKISRQIGILQSKRDVITSQISKITSPERNITVNDTPLNPVINKKRKQPPVTSVTPNQTSNEVETGAVISKVESLFDSKDSKNYETKTILEQLNQEGEKQNIADASGEVNINPSEAQKEAGNYKMGHIKLLGFDITIENPKGSIRSGIDQSGKEWSITMNNTYGYFKGTKGKDGDHIDTFIGDNPTSEKVFVVDQINKDGSFDEHKVMLGFDSIDEATAAYLSNYEKGWQGLGNITETALEQFKKWTDTKTRKQKPFADYKQFQNNEPYGSSNKIVSSERYEELKNKLHQKLGQLNAGFDPELFALGAEMAAYHIEAGARKFSDFAQRMVNDLGENVKPYLKSFYNGARDFPDIMNSNLSDEMTPYDEVRIFEIENLDGRNEKPSTTAEMVVLGHKKQSNPKELKKKDVSSQIELIENEKEDEVQLRNGSGASLRKRGYQSQQNESLGESTKNQSQGLNRRGMDRRDTEHPRTDEERSESISRLSESEQGIELKNTNNNHSGRGENHAPTSVNTRIEANLKAVELAQQLIENGEKATSEQMSILRKFSGWGGLGKAFNDSAYSARIQQLLGAEAYHQAVMSSNSAYYTPAYVVDTLWDIAKQMGFKGGNILEGSAGIGNVLGQMPTNISKCSDIHAIEIDETSGGILSLLYPDAKVEIQGFEKTRIPNGSVDLAITNVPFVTGLRVNDTTGDKDLSKKFHNIHDFCISKNVRKLREGGIGIFITSNGTLDSSKKLRDWIVNDGCADFVGAFRMNNKTFVGTGVTSDIIVIRKRVNGRKSANAIDVSSITGERMAEYDTGETRKIKGQEVAIVKHLAMDYNRYFIEYPKNMAGEMHFAFEYGDTFRPTSKGLYPINDKNQEQMLADFVGSFANMHEKSSQNDGNHTDNSRQYVSDSSADGKKLGELYEKDGKLVVADIGGFYPLEVNDNKVKGHTKMECFSAYATIKKALSEVLAYQTENESNKGLNPLLTKLNKSYDDFVATYGHFNKNTSIAFLRNDVDYPNVFSLEKFEETGDKSGNRVQTFGKTDIFSQRVIEKEKEPTPTNVKDGIVASVFKFGRIDVPYIANHLGESVEAVKHDIIKNRLGFEDPVTRQIELSYKYLSGNVREKLRQAQENNESGEYDSNIKALQEVIPMDIPAHLIDFTLGSSWIDPKLYNDYVQERTDIEVKFTAVGGTWFMSAPEYELNKEKNRSMGVHSEKFNRQIMGHTIIEAAIQNKAIMVSQTYKKSDGSTETVTDKEATQACASKIDEIRQDFKEWARQHMQSNAEISALIERIYNDTFNNYVPMSIPKEFVPEYFDGASHKFKMRPHQSKAIVRGTMQSLLLAHEVGTGKTFTLISTAMEMRRLSTARKPMIVVQNATVGQFVASAKELYPNAKILTLEETDRSAKGRKNFYAKIRYNDWDMIVVPQSTFDFIPDSEERQMTFVQDKIEEKMLVLEKMKEVDQNENSIITRQAEKEIADLESQLAGLSNEASKKRAAEDEKKRALTMQNSEVQAMEMLDRKTDDVENFDDMGIDALLVDEAHEYKHLGFSTAMQRGVKGIDPSYSKKAQGLCLKIQAVLEKNNDRNVIFATGTPISNTAAEIWTFMRYLMPADTMKEYSIYYFDDFVRNFGNLQQMLEFTTSGKFKENNRFAGYVNLPELVRIWSGTSDTVLTKDAGGVNDKIPDLEGGKAQDLYLPQTKALRSIMKFIKAQLEKYDKMSGKEKKANSHIPLTMYGIAKAAAVDARLILANAEDETNSKTNEAVRQTLRSLKETADYNGTVAIFADNYQNKQSGFNLYEDIRTKLINGGISADEIVVIKSGMTVKNKLEIFNKVNRGEIRVLLGSTFTLGTGVNIQERLHTLIHLDAPNRPMDYTQRNGRILRQGNLHKAMGKSVRILRFGVEDSLDVTAYQRLKTKSAIADSIMNGKHIMDNSMTNRVLEEEDDVFGDTVAQLSGSEYAILKNNAEKNVRKYESRKKQWEADQTYIHNVKPKLKGLINESTEHVKQQRKYLQAVQKTFPNGKFTEIKSGNNSFSTIENMADFIKEHNKKIIDKVKELKDSDINVNQTRELTVSIGEYNFKVKTVLSKEMNRSGGQLFTEVRRKMTYSCPELGLEDVPVHQSLLRNAIEDITKNVITGNDFAERIESAERSMKHNQSELEQLLSREGKSFEYDKELEKARAQYTEYAELMKKEMAEKEAKYAEMDKTVEVVSDLNAIDEDDDSFSKEFSFQSEEDANKFASVTNNEELRFRLNTLVEEINDQFNTELQQQIDGILQKGHVYQLGNPGNILLSAGIPNLPIELASERLLDKSKQENHPFDLSNVVNLPDAIQNPIAVFDSKTQPDSKVILTELSNGDKNFVVAIKAVRGKGTSNDRILMINDIRSLYPKDTQQLIKWIEQGLLKWVDKEKTFKWLNIHQSNSGEDIQTPKGSQSVNWITQQQSNSAEVEIQNKDSIIATNIVQKFNNPTIQEGGMIAEIENISQTLNTPVKIVRDINEITDADKSYEKRKRNSKGWYDPQTGEVVIVLPNAKSMEDVQATMLHEIVAHKGLRTLLGDKFDSTMKEVFTDIPLIEQANLLKEYNNPVIAAEEYLASMAEKNIEPTLIQKIIATIKDAFKKIGIDFHIKNSDMLYMLWKSKNHLKSNATILEQLQYAKRNNDVLYRKNSIDNLDTNDIDLSKTEKEVQRIVDRMIFVKKLQKEIEDRGGIVDINANPYIQENLAASRSMAANQKFRKNIYEPLVEKVSELETILTEKGLCTKENAYKTVTDYLYAKHAPERNKHICVEEIRNNIVSKLSKQDLDLLNKNDITSIVGQIYDNVLNETNTKINYNNIVNKSDSFVDIANKMTLLSNIEDKAQADISNIFSSENGNNRSGMADDEAKEILERLYTNDTKKDFNELSTLVKDASNFVTDTWHKHNLISEEQYNDYKTMYNHYIPLRSWDEKEEVDYDSLGKDSFNHVSELVNLNRRAEGRTSRADDPISYIGSMAMSAIVVGNKNEIRIQAFRMVSQNKKLISDLAIIPTMYNVIQSDGSVLETTIKPSQDYFDKGLVKSRKDTSYGWHKTNSELDAHTVPVIINGTRHFIQFKGTMGAQVAAAINNTNVVNWGPLNGKQINIRAISRWVAANRTSRNPEFVFTNFTRDYMFGNMAYWIEGGNIIKLNKNIKIAFNAIHNDFTKSNTNLELQKMYDEFKDDGGQTGFIHLQNIDRMKKEIDILRRKAKGEKTVGDRIFRNTAMQFGADLLEYMNTLSENALRFAVYKTEREKGKSRKEAAYKAKEITVNFNRQGTLTGNYNAIFNFFNATIQGTAKLYTLGKEHPRRFIESVATIATLKFGAALLSALVSGDDDEGKNEYDKLSDYVKFSNIILPSPFEKNQFIAIPMAQGIRGLTNIADVTLDVIRGNKTMGQASKLMFTNILSELSPTEIDAIEITGKQTIGSIFSAFSPTILKPAAEIILNKDFKGAPIYKEDFVKSQEGYTPEYKKVYKNTNPLLIGTSKYLNRFGGGTDNLSSAIKFDKNTGEVSRRWAGYALDINPAIVEHIFSSFIGGRFNFLNNVYQTGSSIVHGAKPDTYNLPIINRFYKETYMKPGYETYFNLRQIVNDINVTEKALKAAEDYESLRIFYNHRINSVLTNQYKGYSSQINKISESMYELPYDSKARKELEQKRDELILECAKNCEKTIKTYNNEAY